MREIKCRGKRIDNGKWVTGYYVKVERLNKNGYDCLIIEEKAEGATYYVLPETVGQHTNMNDKNGTEICEGDIVKISDADGNMDCCDCGIGKVIWDWGMWYIDGKPQNGLYDLHRFYTVEVIGNIHDTPELMEEE